MNEKDCNCIKCGWCCTDMEINILDLVHPETLLPEKGLEFYKVHGLDKILKENGKVKIVHKCQHLTEQNLCGIEDSKPAFCLEWVCKRNLQDGKWFSDRIGEFAVNCLDRINYAFLHTQNESERTGAISFLLEEYYNKVRDLKGGIL